METNACCPRPVNKLRFQQTFSRSGLYASVTSLLWLRHNSRCYNLTLEFKCIEQDGYWYWCARVLIQEATAASRPTVAVQLAVLVLDGELVVVGQLLAAVDLPQGEDDDVLAAVHVDDARVAVWLAGVVDETGRVALHRRVHHIEVVDAEHVAADALMEINNRVSPCFHISSTFSGLTTTCVDVCFFS